MYHAAFDEKKNINLITNEWKWKTFHRAKFFHRFLYSLCAVWRPRYDRIEKHLRLIAVRLGTPDGKIMANELFRRSVSLKRGDPFP